MPTDLSLLKDTSAIMFVASDQGKGCFCISANINYILHILSTEYLSQQIYIA